MACKITYIRQHEPNLVEINDYLFSYETNIRKSGVFKWKGEDYFTIGNMTMYSMGTARHQRQQSISLCEIVIYRDVPTGTVDLEVWWNALTDEEKERVTKP